MCCLEVYTSDWSYGSIWGLCVPLLATLGTALPFLTPKRSLNCVQVSHCWHKSARQGKVLQLFCSTLFPCSYEHP